MKLKCTLLVPLVVWAALWPLLTHVTGLAQVERVVLDDASDTPQALVLSVHGTCSYAEDGATFAALKEGQVLKQGAVVRTSVGAQTDLFFRRIGTTVRLQSETEVKLEKLARHLQDGMPVMETLLHVRTGSLSTVVRSLVPGSTFEIRNAAGRSVVEGGGGKGRYIITADGTQVADQQSVAPLKLVGDGGVTVIAPGQTFRAKDGKLFSVEPSEAVQSLIEFDELDSLAERWAAPEKAAKAPK